MRFVEAILNQKAADSGLLVVFMGVLSTHKDNQGKGDGLCFYSGLSKERHFHIRVKVKWQCENVWLDEASGSKFTVLKLQNIKNGSLSVPDLCWLLGYEGHDF